MSNTTPSTTRTFLILASLFGLLAVIAGTFGAHGLKGRISDDLLVTFEVGVRYHMYHALALLGVAYVCSLTPRRLPVIAGWLMVFGTVVFSGSLYVLAATGFKKLGMVAPIGGTSLMAAWVCLILTAFKLPCQCSATSD